MDEGVRAEGGATKAEDVRRVGYATRAPKLPMSRILVAVSSPWASERLAGPIADLAHRLRCEVLVTHVARLQETDEEESAASERGEQTLERFASLLRSKGVRCDGLMLFEKREDPAGLILHAARSHNCSAIVLGLAARGPAKRLASGDVPANIIRLADLPVILLPANWDGRL